jgi:hypothetical protein
MAAGVPIVPIVFRNADEIASRNAQFMPGTSDAIVLAPVPTGDLDGRGPSQSSPRSATPYVDTRRLASPPADTSRGIQGADRCRNTDDRRHAGHVAVITGGGRGFGKAFGMPRREGPRRPRRHRPRRRGGGGEIVGWRRVVVRVRRERRASGRAMVADIVERQAASTS